MQQAIEKHWDWEPIDKDDSQELMDHVLSLYNELTSGKF